MYSPQCWDCHCLWQTITRKYNNNNNNGVDALGRKCILKCVVCFNSSAVGITFNKRVQTCSGPECQWEAANSNSCLLLSLQRISIPLSPKNIYCSLSKKYLLLSLQKISMALSPKYKLLPSPSPKNIYCAQLSPKNIFCSLSKEYLLLALSPKNIYYAQLSPKVHNVVAFKTGPSKNWIWVQTLSAFERGF